MDLDHSQLPSIRDARLPTAYQHAKQALAECDRVDECKTWADKMAALASYGRQAHDDSLVKHAMRIQNRAWQRAGELLEEIDARQGQNLPTAKSDGGDTFSQREAAKQAGLSKRQQVTAVRIARVPKGKFETLNESDDPPTVTKLAEMGKKARPVVIIDHLEGRDPKDFQLATKVLGGLREFTALIRDADIAAVIRGAYGHERSKALALIPELTSRLETFRHELESADGVQRKRPDLGNQNADRQEAGAQ